jgi:DNA-binding phage protein
VGKKTGFEKYVANKLEDDAFREAYETARAEIDATDSLVRELEAARTRRGLTKAELARRMDVKPEIVRRLLTDEGGNPTLGTVLKVATALGYHLELVPNSGRRTARAREAARAVAASTRARSEERASGTRPRAAARVRSRGR